MSEGKTITTRRAALAATAASLLTPNVASSVLAADAGGDAASLEKAVEAMRAAMASGDAKVLETVLHDRLTYTHSDGRLQTKAEVIEELGGKSTFVTLTFTQQTVDITQDVGVVRHIYDSLRNMPDGKTSTAHIAVLQAWIKAKGGWQLLARASTPIKA